VPNTLPPLKEEVCTVAGPEPYEPANEFRPTNGETLDRSSPSEYLPGSMVIIEAPATDGIKIEDRANTILAAPPTNALPNFVHVKPIYPSPCRDDP
jgi:hypothetical protein